MQKTIILFVSLIVLASQMGCKQATEPASSPMYVSFEIGSAFQNDSVKVILDNKTLLESRVTTNGTISLAWSSELLKLSKDNHKLHFAVMDYGVQKDYNTDTANDTSTVLISFDKNTTQISIEQIKGRIIRE
jgi:hypothetical protein